MTLEKIESNEHLEEEFTRAGTKAQRYKRPPLSEHIFALTMNQKNVLRHWLHGEHNNVSAASDPNHRQAVVAVEESQRQITQTYSVPLQTSGRPDDCVVDLSATRQVAKQHFPVVAPGLRVNDVEIHSDHQHNEHTLRSIARATVLQVTATATIRGSNNYFLAGFDEHRQFICMLDQKPESVEHAHKILRPKNLPTNKQILRQGEWFLVPVNKKEQRYIDKKLQNSPMSVRRGPLNMLSEGVDRSSHFGAMLLPPERPQRPTKKFPGYVNGVVWDERASHHAPIVLDGWHRIVRNNEVEPPRQQRNTTPAAGRMGMRFWD